MTIYFSVDLEYTGPYPQPYQLLSVGCVAFNEEGTELDTFYQAINHPGGQVWDPDTLRFWIDQGQTFKDLLAECEVAQYPGYVFREFGDWVYQTSPDKDLPVLLADPVAADWPWLIYYFGTSQRPNPFKYKGLCIGSYARAKFNLGLWDKIRDLYPSENQHHALDDARAQGREYFWLRDATPEMLEYAKEQLTKNE